MKDTAITARYDHAAPRWGRRLQALGYPAAYRGFVAARLAGLLPGPVLDAGCGAGGFAAAFATVAGEPSRLVLLDASAAMLAAAGRALPRAARVQVNIGDWASGSASP